MQELKDHTFDLVVSIFGAMFAPKPFDVAKEMVRVTRPGGRIVMGNWAPNDPTLVAQILKISAAYSPPPPEGFISPMTWGIENNVIERFAGAGTLAIQGLHAQQTGAQQLPRVFYISEIDVSNPEGYGKEFAPKAQELIKKHGGRVLAIGGTGGGPTQTHPITGFSGEPPKRVTIQGWESLDKVKGWLNDPEYVQLRKDLGEKHAKFRSYAVETQ